MATTDHSKNYQYKQNPWRCIVDPSGMFRGSLFGLLDIKPQGWEDNWAEGLIFRHIYTGKLITIQNLRIMNVNG